MSEVVPLPSFGEVFFDARGQERCLRVTWHEGTLVLSLWRGEMCTASFRMPIEDVGRLLDTLDDGYAEITGEQPAVQEVAQPGEYPGTGQYHRPPQGGEPFPHAQPLDERPTAALPATDVLVARGTPAPPDKLVASYGETTVPRDTPVPQYGEPPRHDPLYGEPPRREPAYVEPTYGTPPQYGAPQYAEPMGGTEPVYQLPSEPRHQRPMMTDPLGMPAQQPDLYGTHGQLPPHPQHVQQQPPPAQSTPGLGTPMHGIPGAGRRTQPQERPQDSYQQPAHGGYQPQANPVDPLLAMGTPVQNTGEYYQEPGVARPYVGEQMFVTGERLRPDQQDDRGERREW